MRRIWVVIFIAAVFLLNQICFMMRIPRIVENPLFVACFLISMLLFLMATLIFIKNIGQTIDQMELFSLIIAIISILIIFITTVGHDAFIHIAVYLGYANVIIGTYRYCTYKRKLNISFILCGFSVIIWTYNLYNTMH